MSKQQSAGGMDDLFNIAAQQNTDFSGAYEEAQPYMELQHMDQVLVAVASIEPRKDELDALTPDKMAKAALHVPWDKGIVLKLLPLKIRRWDNSGDEAKLLEHDLIDLGSEPSNLTINYVCYPKYEQLSNGDIERGYLRVYSPDESHKTLKITAFPPNWSNMPPVQKFQFWWDVISKKFGSPGKLNVGDAFWVYVRIVDKTNEKDEEGNQKYKKAFVNLVKTIKDEKTNAWMDAKFDIIQVPVGLIQEALARIEKPKDDPSETGETPF